MAEQRAPSEELAAVNAIVVVSGRKRRGWLSALVAGVALVAVVAVFGAVTLGRQDGGLAMVGWRTYHDPLGLYSIRIPANWTASAMMSGPFTVGDRTGSFSGMSEDITLSDPAQGGGSASVWIHADQINSAFGRQWYCGERSQERSSFNGYPADGGYPGSAMWLLESYNAHFQIDIEIPGVIEPDYLGGHYPNPPPPTPTSLPASWVKADRAIIASALGSFQPAAGPLSCG